MEQVLIIIQARIGSTRLPGKVIKELAGRPLILRLIDSLNRSKKKMDVIVASSQSKENDPLEQLLNEHHIKMFRGSEENVLSRFTSIIKEYKPEIVVRATADDPLMSAEVMDILIDRVLDSKLDYAMMKDVPKGISVEVVRASVLASLESKYELSAMDREHVTYFITHHPILFKVEYIDALPKYHYPNMEITIDTEEQFKTIEKIYQCYGENTNLDQAIEYLKND